jgi:hypothetical protein
MPGDIGGTQLGRGFGGRPEMRSGHLVATVQNRDRELDDQREQANGRRETASNAWAGNARKNVHGAGQKSKRAAKRGAVKPSFQPGPAAGARPGDPSG